MGKKEPNTIKDKNQKVELDLSGIDLAGIDAMEDSALKAILQEMNQEDEQQHARHSSHSSYSTHGTAVW